MTIFYLLFPLVFVFYIYTRWYKNSLPINLTQYSLLKNQKIQTFAILKEQGHCNINYHLKTSKQEYLIRKFKYHNHREAEFKIQNMAYKKAISAKALLLDKPNNLMICEFIEGVHHHKLNQQELKKLALLLKKLHSIKVQQQPNTLKRNFKFKHKKVYDAFKIIDSFKPEYVLGHNDLHPKNILFGKKIKFIDWEYAGKTDRYFDLVAIIIEFKLNRKDEATFLRTYFSKKTINYKKLKAFKVVYKALWREWFGKFERGQISTI